jgi:hypothetical protein
MRERRVLEFLDHLGRTPGLLAGLRDQPKSAFLAAASAAGFAFAEADFDTTIWDFEAHITGRLGETFDFTASIWETMWGKSYLDYLVDDVATALDPPLREAFFASQ